MTNVKISKKVFNEVYLPYLENEDRYLVFYGGGSSGKSYFIVERWIYLLLKKKMNLLVVRQTADTNRTTTYSEFRKIIKKWHLENLFVCNKSTLTIKCVNGNEVIFKGLDDVEKVKSVTFESGELTHVWIEEATECQEADINQLKVRLRGGNSKKQMVLSFNPVNINHWIKRHFVDGEVEKATVVHTTYKDNKFLSEEDIQTLENFKYTDPYYYEVYCLGHWGVLGKTFFNAEKVTNRLKDIKAPIAIGAFSYKYNGNTITDIKFVPDLEGPIKLYELPKTRYPYVLSGDTAGEGSDYYIGQVIDNTSGKQVATLRKQYDADEYTRQMYCLGKFYNYSLVSIEANFDTFPIKEMYRLGYIKQFVREREDNYTNKHVPAYGFKTTQVTRPLILSALQQIVNEHINLINDRATLEEMLVFVRNEKGRPEAQEGSHDDLIMALAIAYYSRSQESMQIPRELTDTSSFNNINNFKSRTEYNGDIGTKIKVI